MNRRCAMDVVVSRLSAVGAMRPLAFGHSSSLVLLSKLACDAVESTVRVMCWSPNEPFDYMHFMNHEMHLCVGGKCCALVLALAISGLTGVHAPCAQRLGYSDSIVLHVCLCGLAMGLAACCADKHVVRREI